MLKTVFLLLYENILFTFHHIFVIEYGAVIIVVIFCTKVFIIVKQFAKGKVTSFYKFSKRFSADASRFSPSMNFTCHTIKYWTLVFFVIIIHIQSMVNQHVTVTARAISPRI